MPNFKELFKNQYFRTALIVVIIMGVYALYKKQEDEVIEVEGEAEEEEIETADATDSAVYDLNYVLGYVDGAIFVHEA